MTSPHDTINELVNEAILKWAAITGATPEFPMGVKMTLGTLWRLRELTTEAKALNESRDLDPSGVTTFMLLRSFADRYASELTLTAQDFLRDPKGCLAQLQPIQDLKETLDHALALGAVEEFKDTIRRAAHHYGVTGENLKGVEDILTHRPAVLATLRRDALRSLETLEAHQFTQGNPDPANLGFSPVVYEFWNLNSLLRALAGMKIPGITLCLIRDPVSAFFSFFCIAIRNGDTITVLTDRDKHPHPGYREMVVNRRPDRDLMEREARHWFPYELLQEVEISADQKRLYLAQSTALAPVSDEALPIGYIREVDPGSFIWLILMFELVRMRYGEENLQLPETSYTGEMVVNPHSLASSGSDLVVLRGYKPLEAPPLTAADVTTEKLAHQWVDNGAKGHNQWMMDRYASQVPDHVLNTVGKHAALEAMNLLALPGSVGDGPSLLAPQTTETWKDRGKLVLESASLTNGYLHRYRSHKDEFRSLDAVSFGTRQAILDDRAWAARHNQVAVVQALALREFDETVASVREWFRGRVEANIHRILQAVTEGEWILPTDESWGFQTNVTVKERNVVTQVLSRPGMNPGRWGFMTFKDQQKVIPRGIYVGDHGDAIVTGARSFSKGYFCYDLPEIRANVWTTLTPRSLKAISAIVGLPVEEFPWQVRTWQAVHPYTGNNILDRLDPADCELVNPWDSLGFSVIVSLSQRALNARRRTAGLPKAELSEAK